MIKANDDVISLAANTIRGLAIDGVQAANSGHPGAPMGLADIAAVLWLKYLKVDPTSPKWEDRDRFVLSGGHGSMLLYALLHLMGYGVSLDDLKNFRQVGSMTAGHPEFGHTPGVDITTGPLGQGLAAAVGMAAAERMLAARFKVEGQLPLVDHRTWVFCGDGDMEEGVSHEACSLAGNLQLDKLVVFYDSNRITIEGSTDLSMRDDPKLRFKAYDWHVLEIDGHDFEQIDKAIKKAMKLTGKPVLIICHTHIGQGSPNKHDTADAHGAPLGEEEVALTKQAIGLPADQTFYVPEEVRAAFAERAAKGKRIANKWRRYLKEWQTANPALAAQWNACQNDVIPENIYELLPAFDPAKSVATRAASGTVLNTLAKSLPQLVGGSADLAPSNKTYLKEMGDIAAGKFEGRNFHFGIRELGMSCVMNGIAAHGGFRIFGGTFFVFSDYCRPALRLACMMKLPVIFVFSHDSFYVGEDGPTHEPVEQLASLRCMPNLTVIRPAEATETGAAWVAALKNKKGPTAILLTRQGLPVIDREHSPSAANLEKGAYILWQSRDVASTPDLIMIASGSEVSLALEAARMMPDKNVRVVSMPSWELFAKQNQGYRDRVIDVNCNRRMVIEAGSSFGWEKFLANCRATAFVTLDHFGESGPYKKLAEKFGFTPEHVVAKARELFRR